MYKAILYSQVEGAEFSAFRLWKQTPLTVEKLQGVPVGVTHGPTASIDGIAVHAIFFIYPDCSMERWDCVNGFTLMPPHWNASNPVYLKNIQYFLRTCGIE